MLNNLNILPAIIPKREKEKIVSFIKQTLKRQKFEKVVIGMSGGIDSTTSLYLLKDAIGTENIIIAHLYYYRPLVRKVNKVLKQLKIPKNNIYIKSIKNIVDEIATSLSASWRIAPRNDKLLHCYSESRLRWLAERRDEESHKVRLGNIMARTRMIVLYDLAKKHKALVCGSENKSEYLLGYFTRFGDAASDFEPIQHLYKTQVYELAKFLGVTHEIINKVPTAGLWPGQTDEGEFGFTYKEADKVLYLYFDKKWPVEKILKQGFKNAAKIINRYQKNRFKHNVPYIIREVTSTLEVGG